MDTGIPTWKSCHANDDKVPIGTNFNCSEVRCHLFRLRKNAIRWTNPTRVSRICVLSLRWKEKRYHFGKHTIPCAATYSVWSLCQQGYPKPLHGYTHMFCILVDGHLIKELNHQETYSSATVTVTLPPMENWDWRFILISDIWPRKRQENLNFIL